MGTECAWLGLVAAEESSLNVETGDDVKPILVTGATGLLGNNVARCLVQNDERVAVYIRRAPHEAVFDGVRARRFTGDITSIAALEKALSTCAGVIHCAGNVHIGWQAAQEQQKVNVVGTRNVCSLAHKHNLRMVHVSTVNALGVGKPGKVATEDTNYGQAHPAPYVKTKIQADLEVKQWVEKGLNAPLVHPGFMLGPYDWNLSSGRMLKTVVDGFVPFAPSGAMSVATSEMLPRASLPLTAWASPGAPTFLAVTT